MVDAAVQPLADAQPEPLPAADAGPLEACLPPPGTKPSLGPRTNLVDPGLVFESGDVDMFAVSPDSSTVVFIADIEQTGMKRLYATPIGGGPLTRLSHNNASVPGNNVDHFVISSDGTRVFFRGDVDEADVVDIYSVAIIGGQVQNLTPGPLPSLLYHPIALSPDGEWVVFEGTNGAGIGVFTVPVSGGTIHDLAQDVLSFSVTPDSSRLVFVAAGNIKLYSIPIGGGAIASIAAPGADASARVGPEFVISSDSTSLFFSSELTEDSAAKIYRSSLDGTGAALVFGGLEGLVFEYAYAPEVVGDTLLARVGFEGLPHDGLCAVSLTNSTEGCLTPDLAVNGLANRKQHLTPDGAHAFFSGESPGGMRQVYSVPTTGGVPTSLSQNVNYGSFAADAVDPLVTSDSKRVLYVATDLDGVRRVYAVCTEGGAPLVLTPNQGGDVSLSPINSNFELDSAGRFALIRGALVRPGVDGLVMADMLTHEILSVDGALTDPDLGVAEYAFSPDGNWIVFTGDQDFEGVVRLYSRRILQE